MRFDAFFAKEPREGFATNVNVIRQKSEARPSFEDVADQQQRELELLGARRVSPPRRSKLAGEDAAERSYTLGRRNTVLRGRQLVVRHGDRFYFVTFSAKADYFDRDAPDFQEILDSWEWE